MAIFISGSLAFDRIMRFPGAFEECILPDQLHKLNVSFMIDAMVEKRGGTAGNIAYSLALMGEHPYILAAVGKDFSGYATFLQSLGLPLDGIRVLPEEFTPSCYLITDKNNNQINSFYPAAMSYPAEVKALEKAGSQDWVIVSPGNLEDMQIFPKLCRERKIPFIYDPGQGIPALLALASEGAVILEGLRGAALTVTNEYEIEMIMKACGKTRAEIRALCGGLITTLGEKGSLLEVGDLRLIIPAVPPLNVQDPTGAGDSFRSGLLKGLVHGLSLPNAAKMGAVCATFCVEQQGTQEHTFTLETFVARHRATFGETAKVALW